MSMTTGERITALRKGRGMTQEQLAEKLSVSRQSVSKWELDQATPEMGCAVALCDLFGVSLDYLIRGIELQEVKADIVAQPAEKGQEDLPAPVAKPLTIKGYAILFGAVLLLTELLCLNLYPIAVLLDLQTDFVTLFFFLYAVAVPLPAVYIVTHRWWYSNRRHALRHLWKITAGVAMVGNAVLIGSFMFYCRHVSNGLEYAFWHTDWITVSYQYLTGEMMALAILLPVLVCFRRKKWVCWVIYALSGLVFFWSEVLLDALMSLIPTGLGRYWGLADVGMYAFVMAVVLLSQVIVYRRLRDDSLIAEPNPPKPLHPLYSVGGGVLCAAVVTSVTGGLHYALDLVSLPTVYLPMVYVLFPILALMLTRRRTEQPRPLWRTGVWLLGAFLPVMLLNHMGVCYFFCRFYACLGTMPAYHWIGYWIVSAASALVGCAVALPLMVAWRKHAWAFSAVTVVVILLAVGATVLLPPILW